MPLHITLITQPHSTVISEIVIEDINAHIKVKAGCCLIYCALLQCVITLTLSLTLAKNSDYTTLLVIS